MRSALQTAKGTSLEEMQKRFAWKPNDCADALTSMSQVEPRLLAKNNGRQRLGRVSSISPQNDGPKAIPIYISHKTVYAG